MESIPSRPPKPLFADFGDVDKDVGWWERRQAMAYIWGIDPIFAIMAPELTEEKLIELVNNGTGLEITSVTLNKVMADLLDLNIYILL